MGSAYRPSEWRPLVASCHSLEIYTNDGFQATVTALGTAVIGRHPSLPSNVRERQLLYRGRSKAVRQQTTKARHSCWIPTVAVGTVRIGGKRKLRWKGFRGHHDIMNDYQCWFCGEAIDRADTGAVMIGVESLWRWEAGSPSEDDPWQSIYSHSKCAKERMNGATMTLEPSIFGEED